MKRIRELYPELRNEMIRKWPLVRVQYAHEYIENHACCAQVFAQAGVGVQSDLLASETEAQGELAWTQKQI